MITARDAASNPTTSAMIRRLRRRSVIGRGAALARSQDEQEPTVLVVRREDVCLRRFGTIAFRVHDDRLVEHPNAPLERGADVVVAILELEAENLAHGSPDDVLVAQARELARAAAGADQRAVLVGDEERRIGSRVVVVEEFEQEAESAVLAAPRALGEPGAALARHAAIPAVGTDEVGH